MKKQYINALELRRTSMNPGEVKLMFTMDIRDLDGLVVRAVPGNGVAAELETAGRPKNVLPRCSFMPSIARNL